MPKKGQKLPRRVAVGDVRDPDSLWNHARRYLEDLGVRNYSPRTIETPMANAGLPLYLTWVAGGSTVPR